MGKGRKVALLVGVGHYGAGLKSLQCPANGVTALKAVLETPETGGFDEIIPLVDPDVVTMRTRLVEVFSGLKKEDLVLFYFTGHGIKDTMGDFYLTTSQTCLFPNKELNRGTAIEASFVKAEIQRCYAQRKVVVLDCCFGAAFATGFLTMDEGGVDIQADLGGEGYVVLTAATARNYALEKEGEPLSVYTRYLVEGLETGAAAPEGKNYVSVSDLHEYVKGKVQTAAPTMKSAIFNGLEGQEINLVQVVTKPELQYRQKVQSKLRDGQLTGPGRKTLDRLQKRLGISEERAGEIEFQVQKPFEEKKRNLKLYRSLRKEEIQKEFPLSPAVEEDLDEYRKELGLRDEDIRPILEEEVNLKIDPNDLKDSSKLEDEHINPSPAQEKLNVTQSETKQFNLAARIFSRKSKVTFIFALISLAASLMYIFREINSGLANRKATENSALGVQSPESSSPEISQSSDTTEIENLEAPSGTFSYGGSTSWLPAICEEDSLDEYITFRHNSFNVDGGGGQGGSGDGIERVKNEELPFSISSRPLRESEKIQGLKSIAVAQDGIAFVVSDKSQIPGLTIRQIAYIYSEGSKGLWEDIPHFSDSNIVDLTRDGNISFTAYSRDPMTSGTAQHVLENILELSSPDYEPVQDTSDGLDKVEENLGGIYFATATEIYGYETAEIRPLPVGKTSISLHSFYLDDSFRPTDECRYAGFDDEKSDVPVDPDYPNELIRDIYVVIRDDESDGSIAGKAYAQMLLTTEGQKALQQMGYRECRNPDFDETCD
jgi:ABC-type phosphate transport system substrate-binding protein